MPDAASAKRKAYSWPNRALFSGTAGTHITQWYSILCLLSRMRNGSLEDSGKWVKRASWSHVSGETAQSRFQPCPELLDSKEQGERNFLSPGPWLGQVGLAPHTRIVSPASLEGGRNGERVIRPVGQPEVALTAELRRRRRALPAGDHDVRVIRCLDEEHGVVVLAAAIIGDRTCVLDLYTVMTCWLWQVLQVTYGLPELLKLLKLPLEASAGYQ